MKNKIKNIITTTLVSATALSAIGAGVCGTKTVQNTKDTSMLNTKMEVLDTTHAIAPNDKIGKIVETSNLNNNTQKIQFLNNQISEAEIENSITLPTQNGENFNLFVLSSTPYVTFSSNDNSIGINVRFTTESSSSENIISSKEEQIKMNNLALKRSMLMLYANEIYNENVNLSNENKILIANNLKVINENTPSQENKNTNIDQAISSIDQIISIIEANLNNNSCYYQTNLNSSFNNMVSNTSSSSSEIQINENTNNQDIARKIACTLNYCNTSNSAQQINSRQQNRSITQNSTSLSEQNSTNSNSNNNLNNQTNSSDNNIKNTSRRTPYSVRQRNISRQNQISNDVQTNLNNENINNRRYNSRNYQRNINMPEQNKTIRATRTPEIQTPEEYTTQTTSVENSSPRASRVPFRASSNYIQR